MLTVSIPWDEAGYECASECVPGNGRRLVRICCLQEIGNG